jgi:hypothetical protein
MLQLHVIELPLQIIQEFNHSPSYGPDETLLSLHNNITGRQLAREETQVVMLTWSPSTDIYMTSITVGAPLIFRKNSMHTMPSSNIVY